MAVELCNKRGYPSPQAAWNALGSAARRRRSKVKRNGKSRYGYPQVYRCDTCHRWHLSAGTWGAKDEM